MGRAARFQNLIYITLRFPGKQGLLIKENLAFLSNPTVKQRPLLGPPKGSLRRKRSVFRANGLFIHAYLLDSPVKEPFHETGENIWSPSTEHQVDRRPTYSYNGVWPGSPRGSFTTLLLLPQCNAAFSTISSTLDWVDQSSVSQHVS